jgi:hypothetical protein
VAKAIVRCAERPRRELSVGTAPALMAFMYTVLTPLYEAMAPRLVRSRHLGKAPAGDATGNLFQPRAPFRETGGWNRIRPYALWGALAAGGWLALKRRPLLHG